MNRLIAICLAVCAYALSPYGHSEEANKTTLTVFGAASLTNVLQDLATPSRRKPPSR